MLMQTLTDIIQIPKNNNVLSNYNIHSIKKVPNTLMLILLQSSKFMLQLANNFLILIH